MDKFSELKAAALAATQGAWYRGWDNDTGPSDDYFVEWQTAEPARFYEDNSENDADFASKATPETILALLAELEAKNKCIAEAEVRGVEKLAAAFKSWASDETFPDCEA